MSLITPAADPAPAPAAAVTPAPAVTGVAPTPIPTAPNPSLVSPTPNTPGDPAAVTTTTPSPVEGWRNLLPAEIRGDRAFDPIKGKDWAEAGPALAKSFMHAQKMIGADKVALLGPNASEDEKRAFFAKLGCPENAEGYDITLPKGLEESALNKDLLNGWRSEMHKLGLSKAAGEAIIARYLAQEQQMMTERDAGLKHQAQQWINDIKKDFGVDFDMKCNLAKHAVKMLGTPELVSALEDSGMGNHPAVVKFFVSLGAKMNDDMARSSAHIHHNPLGSPEAAQASIHAFQADKEKMAALHDPRHVNHDAVVKERAALFAAAFPEAKNQ